MKHREIAIFSVCSLSVLCFLLLPLAASAAIPEQERNALINFYDITGGEYWVSNTGWLGPSGTECTWFGVECNAEGTSVISLDLKRNGIGSTIPD